MFSCFSFLFCVLPTVIQAACTGISFRGGGSFGAVEVGMLQSVLDTQQLAPNSLKVVAGISAGGLNAGFLTSATEATDFPSAVSQLKTVYTTLSNSDVYHLNLLRLFSDWSIYQTDALNKTIHTILGKLQSSYAAPFQTLIGASNIQTGLLDVFEYGGIQDVSQKAQVLMATSAIPFAFPPVRIEDEGDLYVDGGLIDNEMIFQMLPYLTCKKPVIWYFAPTNTLTTIPAPTQFMGYFHRILSLVSNGFDNQLEKLLRKPGFVCPIEARSVTIKICNPSEDGAYQLDRYSILQFGYGLELYEIGYSTVQCAPWILCY